MNNFAYSKNGLALTKQFEGCRLAAYQDGGGIWTIGYGHTHGVKAGDTCTQAQADEWLQEDILFAATAVNRLVSVPLTQNEFDSLTDFIFNLGVGNFAASTLLKLLNAGDFAGAAAQFDHWELVAGKVSAGILNRRNAETNEFLA